MLQVTIELPDQLAKQLNTYLQNHPEATMAWLIHITLSLNSLIPINTDKQWSLTDCAFYVVMKAQGITKAFTFDHHFAQMGFIPCSD